MAGGAGCRGRGGGIRVVGPTLRRRGGGRGGAVRHGEAARIVRSVQQRKKKDYKNAQFARPTFCSSKWKRFRRFQEVWAQPQVQNREVSHCASHILGRKVRGGNTSHIGVASLRCFWWWHCSYFQRELERTGGKKTPQ